ncbi:uncharacterized protein I303_104998 [Kwoniella dejecticola CBS 10117]|uniref:Uncharacterized protein n=1 Tax=Kwoniella dejecticola CBS 10117 TaxID=1296121 RepID=A0A1A6A3R6_9TREE|nr:uncharacterized protein I303_05558 [Kwoniella dejecticola CBS 10117]OBR84699.1 hypothetical protein I303_05558 [Kwoniella dejecticola CBS 10117]
MTQNKTATPSSASCGDNDAIYTLSSSAADPNTPTRSSGIDGSSRFSDTRVFRSRGNTAAGSTFQVQGIDLTPETAAQFPGASYPSASASVYADDGSDTRIQRSVVQSTEEDRSTADARKPSVPGLGISRSARRRRAAKRRREAARSRLATSPADSSSGNVPSHVADDKVSDVDEEYGEFEAEQRNTGPNARRNLVFDRAKQSNIAMSKQDEIEDNEARGGSRQANGSVVLDGSAFFNGL